MTTNFTAKTLAPRLRSEACGGYRIHALGDDVFCLIQEKGLWQVVYAERGAVQGLMQFGLSLSELEQSLGLSASLEWKHAIIAQLLGTPAENLEQKLTAWQEQHGTS